MFIHNKMLYLQFESTESAFYCICAFHYFIIECSCP